MGLASAGIFMLVTKKGYRGGVKDKQVYTTLATPAVLGGVLGYARTRSDS
jgi:hypothetical protein